MSATIERVDARDFPPVEKNIERPGTLSQTLLGKHDNCPRSAYLERAFKTASIERDRGIAVHEAIERCQTRMLEEGEVTIPGDVARQIAEEVMRERTDLVLPTREQDRVRAIVWNWSESQFGSVDPAALVGIELPMAMEIGGFLITARIDRVDFGGTTLYVFDYKSGWPGRREDTEDSFQGKLYGAELLWGHRYDPTADEIVLHPTTLGANVTDVWFYEIFPRRRDDETGHVVALEGVWSKTELYEFKQSLERNVAAFAKSLETGLWPARDGSWCEYCPAPTECPIPAHLRQVEHIATVADAEDAFSQNMALEREKRRNQDALRAWVKEHGPVYVGDLAFDGTVQTSREVVSWEKLEHALYQSQEFGVPFVQRDHVRPKTSTKFAKRKLNKEERDGAGEG